MYKKISLVLIITLSIIVIRQNYSTGTIQPEPMYLTPASGFEPATIISDADAYEYANNFKTVFGKGGEIVSGGMITREAFNAIFANEECNAVTYKLCTDPSGKFASPKTIFLVLSGAKVEIANTQTTVTEIGVGKYSSKQWCPPSCMKFMIRDANGELEPQE